MTPARVAPGPPRLSIGVDYGTSSVRALIVDIDTGEEIATGEWAYAHGRGGVVTSDRDTHLARQHPADYEEGFRQAVGETVRVASRHHDFAAECVVGLGVDTTGSTPIPLDENAVPLACLDDFAGDPDAMAWLWKDHTSHAEAQRITETAEGTPYLASCGGVYSSEWFWAKLLRCAQTNPGVFDAAHTWVELCDYVPAMLTGTASPREIVRGVCAAGHKGLFHPAWGGLPPADFFAALHPGLARVRASYAQPALPSSRSAGALCAQFADAVGLPAGLPVAVGTLDAHAGAVGAGVGPGTLVKVLGTSTCDCMVAPNRDGVAGIPGVSGVVPESIIPGMIGIEAGQSAVGDIFDWYVSKIVSTSTHDQLTAEAASFRPGQSGLLALDWHNGNRNVLADPLLSGMILGYSLQTTPAEVYRTLIEATAFGARMILERMAGHGVAVERVVNCGGIAERNPLLMQIYADVCGRSMHIAKSGQACALGAAVYGAVAGGGHPDVPAAQAVMTGTKDTVYQPDPERAAVYDELFGLYVALHDAFGGVNPAANLGDVMKRLLSISNRVRRSGR